MAAILESKMAATVTFQTIFIRFNDPKNGGVATKIVFLAFLVFEILGKIYFRWRPS